MTVQPEEWKTVRKSQPVSNDSPDERRQFENSAFVRKRIPKVVPPYCWGAKLRRPGKGCAPQCVQKETHMRRRGKELLSEG